MRYRILLTLLAFWFLLAPPIQAYETWMVGLSPQTELHLVNPSELPQKVVIRSYHLDGQLLQQEVQQLEPRHKLIWFSPSDSQTSVLFHSPGAILVDAVWEEGSSFYEQTGAPEFATPLYFPHIAEQTDYWETKAMLVTSTKSRVFLADTVLPATEPHSTALINLEDHLESDSATAWRHLNSISQTTAGRYVFHNTQETQSVSLPLNFVKDTYLILPHIPSDTNTWWTGLVLLNPGSHTADVEFTWHLGNGSQSTSQMEIEPGSKYATLLSALEPPAGAEWAEIKSSQSLLGFELFGTTNEQSLCGLPLTNLFSKRHIFTRTGDDATWSGLALLNPADKNVTVQLNQYDHSGNLLRSDPVSLQPKERVRFIPETSYPVAQSSWLECESDHAFYTFQLIGKHDQTGLAALLGKSVSNGQIHLAYINGLDDQLWDIDQRFYYRDINGNGEADFVLSNEEGITLIADPVSDYRVIAYRYEDMLFENEGPLPAELAIADLNADGLMEFLILDTKLHIYTRLNDEEMVLFQNQLPDLEGAGKITGFADTNRDGFLDILTGRGYYKSFATLDNPYFTNAFPWQLRTSGRASRFHLLNDDAIPDLLTTLQDGFHAFLSYGSTDDIGEPLYVPRELGYILDIYQVDMDGDGRKDVISLLGSSANNQFGDAIHIADLRWENSRFISEYNLPDHLGIGQLSLTAGVEHPQTAFLKQKLASCTRTMSLSQDGIVAISHRTGYGIVTDWNKDGIDDFIAPWAVEVTEPNQKRSNPAFLYYDDAISSYENTITRYSDQMNWVSTEVVAPGSFATLKIWEEKGYMRTPELVNSINRSIKNPALVEQYDIDRDGDLDILVSGLGLTVYKNEGETYAASPEYIHTAAVFTILNAMSCDLNGNEFPDLIGNHLSGSGQLHCVYDYLSDTPTSLTLDIIAEKQHVLFCDLDGDGLNDMIVQNPKRQRKAFINSGRNSFTELALPEEFQAMTVMDITGNGLPDIIAFLYFPERNTSYLRIYKNKGNLNFSYLPIQEIEHQAPYYALLSLDVDHDGKKDVLAFTQERKPVMDIFKNVWNEMEQLPFEKVGFCMINDTPLPSVKDGNTDHIPDLMLQYNGVQTWRFNKVRINDNLNASH
ncbi:MAG: hypothetical protein CSA81_06005 [Acidobacteria bacterium]|nr:MAG: hypothetical protein CSA81_06005 [Acidobacteriota bacterium]PIE89608.1 MAG: hypothetical protein CR997_10365 [Acidobacteriota bacterium]